MISRGGLSLALALAALGAVIGCETVDLGAPPADVNACEPGQQWFIDQIWPNFLGQAYGGKHCYDVSCHAIGSPNGLILTVPAEPGTIPFPADWANNYASAANEMNCSLVDESRLLILPENVQVHGGGMLIMPGGPEAMLVEQWVTNP